jgi:hypothetical protein
MTGFGFFFGFFLEAITGLLAVGTCQPEYEQARLQQ